jgi:hypothetical protein
MLFQNTVLKHLSKSSASKSVKAINAQAAKIHAADRWEPAVARRARSGDQESFLLRHAEFGCGCPSSRDSHSRRPASTAFPRATTRRSTPHQAPESRGLFPVSRTRARRGFSTGQNPSLKRTPSPCGACRPTKVTILVKAVDSSERDARMKASKSLLFNDFTMMSAARQPTTGLRGCANEAVGRAE